MEQTRIIAHADIPAGALQHNWKYIGYDECNFTHMPRGTELIRKFGRLDPPYWFRAHHMLCTGNMHGLYKWGSTNIYREDENGRPVYSFDCIDRMFDIWTGSGNLPFFEIGFMPRDLARPQEDGQPYTDETYRAVGWAMPPKDWNRWYGLIRDLMTHLKTRYGEEALRRWYFELWNEPDIFYWKGTREEYFRLFDYTEAAVHSVIPSARFGGPAVTGSNDSASPASSFLRDFLRHCRTGTNCCSGKTGTRLDFTSFHSKGGIYNTDLRAVKQFPSVSLFTDNCRVMSGILREEGYSGLECVVSEADPDSWAAGGRFDNFNLNFRNTEYYPGWVACAYKHLQDLADSRGMDMRPLAWAFEFEAERCFEGTRAFATQGIDKPLFNLFRFYAGLGTERIRLETVRSPETVADTQTAEIDGWATRREDGTCAVLLYAHHDDWDVTECTPVHFTLGGLPAGTVRITHYRIDGEHSNAYAEWVRQGCPDWPTATQYSAIRARSGPETLTPPYTQEVTDGAVQMTFPMPAHCVSLILVTDAESPAAVP